MADALKAAGNKLFVEKKFDEAMCVSTLYQILLILGSLKQKQILRSNRD